MYIGTLPQSLKVSIVHSHWQQLLRASRVYRFLDHLPSEKRPVGDAGGIDPWTVSMPDVLCYKATLFPLWFLL